MPKRIYRVALISICFLFFIKCAGSDPTAEEKAKKILIRGNGTWAPSSTGSSILLDGNDVAEDLFPGFTIRFTEDKVFTTGTTPVWLREDTWHFKEGSKAKIIIRGMDDTEIAIEEISSTALKLTLEWDQTTYGGRSSSLPGLYEFILNK